MEKSIVGEVKRYEGKAVVCFLDVLGFSKFIKENWNNKDKHPLNDLLELKEKLKGDRFSNGLLFKMHNGDKIQQTHYNCNVKTMSDSVIVSIPINDGLTIADVVFLVSSMMNNIMRFWGMALSFGFTIRGGIEYGDIYWDKNELIGPAFINAYELECKVADKSRIVCGTGFIHFLLGLVNQADTLGKRELRNFIIEENLLCANPNMLYDIDSDREEILNIVRSLMKDQPSKIYKKYEMLESALSDPSSIKIPDKSDLIELYTSNLKLNII